MAFILPCGHRLKVYFLEYRKVSSIFPSMASPNSNEHVYACKRNEESRQDIDGNSNNSLEEILSTLPRETGWSSEYLFRYQGFWLEQSFMPGTIKVQQQFRPRSTDILLITTPKSGTTWLKALTFSIVNRNRYDVASKHPLLTTSPHDCVPFLEIEYALNPNWDPQILPSPRLLASHLPYSLLPNPVQKSGSRIVYAYREPKDVFVSLWLFAKRIKEKMKLQPLSLEEAFDLFSRGVSNAGPYWEHVLGYFKASLESPPNNILFLRYEEMKENTLVQVKKLAEFLGHPFSLLEEESGVAQEIVDLCSFENLRNLEANRTGYLHRIVKKEWFFRKGNVGDWKNHLTPQMIQCLDRVTEQKFGGFGLSFQRQDGGTGPSSAKCRVTNEPVG